MGDKVQTGLRIPTALYNELKARADRAGISINTLCLMLIDIGLDAVNLGIQESARVVPRTLRDTFGE